MDLDEVAHYEPPHQDLRCLQIQLFSCLLVRVKGISKEYLFFLLQKKGEFQLTI